MPARRSWVFLTDSTADFLEDPPKRSHPLLPTSRRPLTIPTRAPISVIIICLLAKLFATTPPNEHTFIHEYGTRISARQSCRVVTVVGLSSVRAAELYDDSPDLRDRRNAHGLTPLPPRCPDGGSKDLSHSDSITSSYAEITPPATPA